MSLWSMTGFVTRSRELPSGTLTVNLKSLNNRGFECSIRAPQELQAIEQKIRQDIRSVLRRGKIECTIFRSSTRSVSLNSAEPLLLESFKAKVEDFSKACALIGHPVALDAATLMRFWNEREEAELPKEQIETEVSELIQEAIALLATERLKEGVEIKKEFLTRLTQLTSFRNRISEIASGLFERTKLVLEKRLAGLAPLQQLPENLRMEIAALAKGSDVTEEITRIEIHEKKLSELLNGAEEGVGREIDFVCQELLREWNTLSVKAQDATISQASVSAKLEIERIREQAANVG